MAFLSHLVGRACGLCRLVVEQQCNGLGVCRWLAHRFITQSNLDLLGARGLAAAGRIAFSLWDSSHLCNE